MNTQINVNMLSNQWKQNVVARALKVLATKDRIKVGLLALIQIVLNFLDLAGVAVIGMIGAITINGSASRPPGDRVSSILELLQLETLELTKQVSVLGVLAAFLLIGKTMSTIYLTRRTMFFLGHRASRITQELIYKMLNQSFQEIQKRSIQENVYIITGGVTTITNGIISAFISLISDSVLLFVMIAGLFYVDPKTAFLSIMLFGIISLILFRLTHARANTLGKKQMLYSIKSIEMIHEVIKSFREAVIGGRRAFYSEQIGMSQTNLTRNQAELSFLPTISKYVLEVTVVIGFLVISAVTFSSNSAARSVAVISVFLAASTRIAPAILRLQQVAITIKSAAAAALPTLKLIENFASLDTPKDNVNRFKNVHDGFTARINIDRATFTYEGNSKPTLNSITLNIEPGQIVALVGRSGAGKTTLADLIIGVLEPEVGEITISNLKAQEVSRFFPGSISYVPQEVFIANGTIRSNICLGFNPYEVPDECIWEALKSAELDEVVNELPKKLDEAVGDNGSKLSGGQRQRLGIARAMITKPEVLVLDEATSSLDSQTEQNITESILKLGGKVTVIIIAHRLSTVKNADVVAYLEDGKIKSVGSFEKVRGEVPDFDKQAKLLGI
jgi:ABC-type multidrug transport system fused ATPase/permease subunit